MRMFVNGPVYRHRWPRVVVSACSIALNLTLSSCKDLAGTQPLPAGTVSPGIVQSAAGAAATAVAAMHSFQSAFAMYIPVAGELTDELVSQARGEARVGAQQFPSEYDQIQVDARLLDQSADWSSTNPPFATDAVYTGLQNVRGSARQAIGGLAAYAATTSATERGELYALMGYAEIMLADLFCSGIPLSTLDFHGDYTYQPGSTTAQVYQHAIALFDTAQMLATDSAPIMYLAQVGQGRAYVALGDYAAAGQAVAGVPVTFQYADSILTCGAEGAWCPELTIGSGVLASRFAEFQYPAIASVSDREGGIGLPFISSGDPRTASSIFGVSQYTQDPAYIPNKYNPTGISSIILASGIEAQLITAEAQLNANDASAAFATLNALRTNNPITAGQLPPLVDPGTFSAEVDTLFTERAAWLFVDGHRQGDLRRLVRQYEHTQQVSVVANGYPHGAYPEVGIYGVFVDAPLPAAELTNPLFTGCLSRD